MGVVGAEGVWAQIGGLFQNFLCTAGVGAVRAGAEGFGHALEACAMSGGSRGHAGWGCRRIKASLPIGVLSPQPRLGAVGAEGVWARIGGL